MKASTAAESCRETAMYLLGTKSILGPFPETATYERARTSNRTLARRSRAADRELVDRPFHLGKKIVTNTSKTVRRISLALAVINAAICTTVHAEYRCSTPQLLTMWEQRACELARQDTPDALIHFIHRINMINAGLNIDDYVGKVDAERWELAGQKTPAEPLRSAVANNSAKGAKKTK